MRQRNFDDGYTQ